MLVTKEDYLAHHGVKGMKWGVRNTIRKVSSASKRFARSLGNTSRRLKAKKNAVINKKLEKDRMRVEKKQEMQKVLNTRDRKLALSTHDPKVLAKHQHLLTDTELRARYNRLQLEKQVRDLTPKQESKGKKAVQAAFNFANSKQGQALIELGVGELNKRINKKDDDAPKIKTGDDEKKKKK